MGFVNERSRQGRETMAKRLGLPSSLQALVANQEAGPELSVILIIQEKLYIKIFA